jgi:hypothetical protein
MAISEYVSKIRRFGPILYPAINNICPHPPDLAGIFAESLKLPTAETGI